MKRIAIYVRASGKGVEAERDLAQQARACRHAVARDGGDVVAIFADRASGVGPRLGLEGLVEAARRGDFGEVLTVDRSRLGREGLEVASLIAQLSEHGISVQFCVSTE